MAGLSQPPAEFAPLRFAGMSSSPIDQGAVLSQVVDTLKNRIALGEVILFTGAGFSHDATSVHGAPIPSSRELRALLWPIAFPGEPEDEESSLGDVFDCAVDQSADRVRELLETRMRVDHSQLPSHYETWFSMPWARAYTLNVDDLADAICRRFQLSRNIRCISASEPVATSSNDLVCVHLNHQLQQFPDVTFSAPQYASRIPGRDPWYATLATEIVSHTIVFVGTTLDEPPLWQHLELRGRQTPGRELRPRSFLVAPRLSIARQRMLKSLNVQHIPMTAREFAETVLDELTDASALGHKKLADSPRSSARSPEVRDVAQLRHDNSSVDLNRYLRGREPTFLDVTEGFAIRRSFENEMLDHESLLDARVILIDGTAGTGKSTALRRLALSLDAKGKRVGWFDPRPEGTGIPALRKAIVQSGYDYVVIDDVDVFAEQTGPLLRELADSTESPRIIAAARSTRAERFSLRGHLDDVVASYVTAPALTDSDIDGLLDALTNAGLLGRLAGQTRSQQRQAFRRLAGRQLLVAMIEATSGQRFQDKIDDECSQLPSEQLFLYAICALATRNRIGLELDEILAAAGDTNSTELDHIDALKRQFLLVPDAEGRLVVRHRVIAEHVTRSLRREGQLANPVEGLLFSMAVQYLQVRSKSSRTFRLMVRLLNHEFMIHELEDVSAIRRIYESMRRILSDDPHFWLQSGSFELKVGDLDLADNYLNQALSLDSDDYRIRTAWCHMNLRRAAEIALDGEDGWRNRAALAMDELDEVIRDVGARDYHAYHIMGSQGLHYVRRAPLGFDERRTLLERLRSTVEKGVRMHSYSSELSQLHQDVEREYLRLAVRDVQDVGDREATA